MRRTLGLGLAALVGGLLAAAPGAAAAQASTTAVAASVISKPFPAQVYLPYFETWTADSVSAQARRSGARYLALAFLQTPRPGSCALTWNGLRSQPVPGRRYQGQIRQLRLIGGDVVPSFGGASADSSGTELADSCHSVARIARDYERLVADYGLRRLDMDVEGNSDFDLAGIRRRNDAIRLLEQWAARHHRQAQVDYTLPTGPRGLPAAEVRLLRNAVAEHARITVVNIMAFDYYDGTTNMARAAITAAEGLHIQLSRIYPHRSSARRWAMEGITLLPGIDDNPNKREVTRLAAAREVDRFARAHGFGLLSIWAIQRDNGGCPGHVDSNSCSGIAQPRWAFSHLLEPFTRS